MIQFCDLIFASGGQKLAALSFSVVKSALLSMGLSLGTFWERSQKMKIMKSVKWTGIALVAGLAATSVEIALNKNRYDYVRYRIFGLQDAPAQQTQSPMNSNVQK